MSHRIKDHPPRVFFRCGNPFKNLFPKTNNARIFPNLLSLLNSFETSLMLSIRELIPKDDGNAILTVSWMKEAMASLCETHKSIRTLVTDLELHVSDLEENFIYIYSDISSKLLELCNSFTSELDRLNHGNMLLKFTFSKLETSSCSEEISLLHLESWRQHMASKNPRIENCGAILSSLVESLKHHHHSLSKKKLSGKGKVLLRALYGVKVKTLYITSVFAAVFSGSSNNLLYLTIPKEMEEVPWAQGFMELQNMVNPEIKNAFLSDRFTVIKELEAVELGVKKLHTAVQEGSDTNALVESTGKASMLICVLTDDNGRPVCADGRLVCTDGRPVCADGRPVCTDGHTDTHGRPACADGRPVCADGRPRTSSTATDVLCVLTDGHGRPLCADGSPVCTDGRPATTDVLRVLTDVLRVLTDVLCVLTDVLCALTDTRTHTDSHRHPACADRRPACAYGRPVCADGRPVCTDGHTDSHGRPACADGRPVCTEQTAHVGQNHPNSPRSVLICVLMDSQTSCMC
ncbi:hypothetical protein IGI04_036634 [Brassica rapa subsp. trilocularis]|uniref:Uncharacterized protein n=1 Tax=Brassica rapa subsp. trilocularis TaxID=1813537 RepID=A0ABQ7LF45_BRACM|nr:hypothetical protein IGI04_036634 [Brassica rapa subsp. trilocularis]